MKKIWTLILVFFLIAGFSSVTNAQISVGVNAGVANPMGSFQQGYNMGFGGYATAAYTLNEKIAIGFNTGFYTFKGIDYPAGSNSSTRIIPIFADFKFFLNTDGFMPYVGTGLGLYLVYSNYTTPASDAVTVGGVILEPAKLSIEHATNEKKFGVSPTVGFWLGDGLKYGASATYHITFSDASYIGINIGIIYPLGE
ncbi:MAG: hypothetical protein ACOYO1_11525 [Bacteroidales bacterium]